MDYGCVVKTIWTGKEREEVRRSITKNSICRLITHFSTWRTRPRKLSTLRSSCLRRCTAALIGSVIAASVMPWMFYFLIAHRRRHLSNFRLVFWTFTYSTNSCLLFSFYLLSVVFRCCSKCCRGIPLANSARRWLKPLLSMSKLFTCVNQPGTWVCEYICVGTHLTNTNTHTRSAGTIGAVPLLIATQKHLKIGGHNHGCRTTDHVPGFGARGLASGCALCPLGPWCLACKVSPVFGGEGYQHKH